MSAELAALRRVLGERFPDAMPITHRTAEQVGTGIALLDRALPSGGLPRGRLSIWAPHGGASALLRAACQTVIANGERAAWIDGGQLIAGDSWVEGPLLLRPQSPRHGMRAADEVLRSGGFALVVLTGIDPRGAEMVRLTRAAREGGAALVTLTHYTALSSLRLTSRIDPRGYAWRRTPFNDPAEVQHATVRINVQAIGWNRQAEIIIPVTHHELRLSLEPGLADRRGISR